MRRCLLPLLVAAFAVLAPAAAHAAAIAVSRTADTAVGVACADIAACSLREAVEWANASAGPDSILVPAGTYPLDNGELHVTGSLVVNAVGPGRPVVDAQSLSRIFSVNSGVDLTVRRLVLTGGRSGVGDGGAIATLSGSLVLDQVHLHDNVAVAGASSAAGGAVYSNGDVTITDSVLEDNRATSTGSSAVGGALASFGAAPDVTLVRTTFRDNIAEGADGAYGGGARTGGPATITDTTFLRNTAQVTGPTGDARGGGVWAYNGPLTMSGSTIRQNLADGWAGTGAGGGLIRTDGIGGDPGTATIETTRIQDNVARGTTALGGGVATDGQPIVLRRSTVDGNAATSPGAGGDAYGGAAATMGAGTLTLDRATITGNDVTGGASGTAVGGAMWLDTDGSSAAGSTITANGVSAGAGALLGGGGIAGDTAARQFTLTGSILAGNVGPGVNADCTTLTLASGGGNVLDVGGPGTQCTYTAGAADVVTATPRLDALGDYGGPTPTMRPQATSPALDRYAGCAGTDQRGIARPQGAACDAGAFEARLATYDPVPASRAFGPLIVGDTSAAQDITLSNVGDLAGQPSLALGGDAGDFTASGCATPIQPGDSCTGNVRFTPASSGAKSATLHGVTLTGTGLDPVPTCANTTVSTGYETGVDIGLACTPAPASRAVVDAPDHGTLGTLGATVRYTPAPGFVGTDTFSFTGTNGTGTSVATTVTVTVLAPPAPVCADARVTAAFGATATASLSCTGIVTGWEIVGAPRHGTLGPVGTSVTYTPAAGWSGEDGFTFRAIGPGGTPSNVARVTVAVAAALPLPIPASPQPAAPAPAPLPPACTGRSVSILELTPRGSRIAVRGVALRASAGEPVLLLAGDRPLGSTVVGADGVFTATLPRRVGSARVVAAVGRARSLPYAVERRTRILSRKVAGSRVRIVAAVRGARAGAVVAIMRQDACGPSTSFGAARVGRDGRVELRLPLPRAGEPLALYRAIAPIPGASSFTLPIAVTAKG